MERRFLSALFGIMVLGLVLPALGQADAGILSPQLAPSANPATLLTRIFAPELLPTAPTRPAAPRYCGVEISALVAEHWSRLTPALKTRIPNAYRPLRYQEPVAKSATGIEVCDAFWDSAHFRIHYSTQPRQQPPGYPDLQAVYDLADHLETAYVFHRDVSGMGVVLPDSAEGGGLNLIDCYFFDLDRNVFGTAVRGTSVATACEYSCAGYIMINIDFGILAYDDQIRLTSEHEYYHLLQYAHNYTQTRWFLESTARNSEFHVWPDRATPRGVEEWMQHPYRRFYDGTGYHSYAPHFWFYLEAHHGRDVVTRLWDGCCHTDSWGALVDELDRQGTDLDAVLTDFAIWNYFAGQRDDGRHYDPALGVPAVYYQAAHHDYPVTARDLGNRIAQVSGSNYVLFAGPATANNLRLTVDGDPVMSDNRAVTILGVNDWGHEAWTLTPDDQGDVDFLVPDWGLYDHVALIVSNLWGASVDSAGLHYTYAAEEVAETDRGKRSQLVTSAPNPFSDETRVVYFAPRNDSSFRVQVFDAAGRRVRSLVEQPPYAGQHQVAWDGTDQNGRRVPAGVYFVRLDDGVHQETRKVLFVR